MSKTNERVAPGVWKLGHGYVALYSNKSRSIESSRWFLDIDSAKEYAETGVAP